MPSGGTGGGSGSRPKSTWQEAPAWSMGSRQEWQIVPSEQQSHPGPGAYNLAYAPKQRLPHSKGVARSKKDTFAGFSPVYKEVARVPGPGSYVIKGEFERISHLQNRSMEKAKKDTMAGFNPNLKNANQIPGPGAYVIMGDFDKKPKRFAGSPRSISSPRSAPQPPVTHVPTASTWGVPTSALQATGAPTAAGPEGASGQYPEVLSKTDLFNFQQMKWQFDSPRKQAQRAKLGRFAMPTAASKARLEANAKRVGKA